MSNTTNSSSLVPLGYVGHTYDGTGSGGYIAFLVVYMVIFLLGNYLHFKYRMYQPLRARDTKLILLAAWLPIAPFITFLVRAEWGDMSPAICWASWVMANLFGPVFVLPFELGALGLVYVYEWNLEKLTRSKGFFRRNHRVFFSTWFRLAIIVTFIIAQFAISFGVQHTMVTHPGDYCMTMSPIASAPLFVIYACIFVVVLYKLFQIDDVFEMKREYLVVFFTAITATITWLVTTAMQQGGKLDQSVFFTIIVCAEIATVDLVLLYWPLVLLTREPWASIKRAYDNTNTITDSDNGLTSSNVNSSQGVPDSEDQVALEDLKSGKATAANVSLKTYLLDRMYAESFKSHCVKSFCTESVMFYLDSRDAMSQSTLRTSAELEEITRKLMELYIYLGADLEVNIPSVIRDPILREYETTKDDPRILKPAVSEIYWMLKNNVFDSWLQSHDFNRVRLMHTSPDSLAASSSSHTAKRRGHNAASAKHPLGLDTISPTHSVKGLVSSDSTLNPGGEGAIEIVLNELHVPDDTA